MEALNRLLEIVNENGEKLGIRNAKKTKVMIIGKDTRDEDEPRRIMVNGNTIEKVDSVIYLDQLFTSDGR